MRQIAAAILLAALPLAGWARSPETSPPPVPRGTSEAAKPEGSTLVPHAADLLTEADAGFIACLDDLRQLGVEADVLDPVIDQDVACGIAHPVRVGAIAPGVSLAPEAVMRCETARSLGTWTVNFLVPASRLLPNREKLAGIDHGSAYVCRRRKSSPDGMLNEHSFGNALDVMGFRFSEGPPIAVQPREREGTPAEAYQDTARATACMMFTTVLGPGSDEAHADHLHLDIKQRRGGFRLCQ